jgi:hypothetical protein
MNVLNRSSARKAVRTVRPTLDTAAPATPATRYILARFDVSPSLARTIACLAQIGGRS